MIKISRPIDIYDFLYNPYIPISLIKEDDWRQEEILEKLKKYQRKFDFMPIPLKFPLKALGGAFIKERIIILHLSGLNREIKIFLKDSLKPLKKN